MILNLREFEEFPARTTLMAAPGELSPVRDDVRSIGAVSLAVSIQKSGDEFFCQGHVTGTVEIECARCLGSYELELEGDADFVLTTAEVREQQGAEGVDNEDYVLFDGNALQVDLRDVVRQVLLVELPLKPICSDSCKGLCSVCGANLNLTSCQCDTKKTDARWEALEALRKKMSSEKE